MGLFLEGLIFGGAYLQREICVSKSIGIALKLEVNLPFLLCFTLYLRVIFQVQALGGAYIWRGDLTEGFLRYQFGGLIFGGAYTGRGLFSEFYGILLFRATTSRYFRELSFVSKHQIGKCQCTFQWQITSAEQRYDFQQYTRNFHFQKLLKLKKVGPAFSVFH